MRDVHSVLDTMYDVLVPIDRDAERARNQVEYVLSLPGTDEIEATVLHVTPREESTSGERAFDDVDAAVEAAERLEEAGITVDRAVDIGTVTKKIIEYANDIDAAEIVLGGRKRSGVAKVLVGSVAQDVIYSSDRPVVITG
jgi:nucleotide-binding universal stress UspA family protein